MGFGLRLCVALLVTLALVGAASYKLISDQLYQHQVDDYESIQAADASGFEEPVAFSWRWQPSPIRPARP